MMARQHLTKADIEKLLDDLVPNIVKKFSGDQAIPGWHLVSVNFPFELGFTVIRHAKFPDGVVYVALLHKSREDQGSPFPGQAHPTASVMGMPSAVKPFRTATRTWNSAT